MIGGLVEVLQRFHALVPRASRRVAVVQNGFQQILAFRIVSGQTKTFHVQFASSTIINSCCYNENLLAGRVSMMARAGQDQFHRLLDLVDV